VQQTQREYYLREQLKAIQKELGEQDDTTRDVEEFKEKIDQSGMPEDVKKEAMKELNRLSRMSPMAADYSVTRNYLEWLVVLPWTKSSGAQVDITKAKVILDEDHYDLQKVKDRILDYLSVRHLNPKMKGPILCFFGPPGVGKTSLGKSIARALGRKFVRMSLGGIHDEAEIRGHRRTYIGAMPGQIIQASAAPKPTIPSSCWMKSTKWDATIAAILRRLCSKRLIRSRTQPSATTIST
jgi:ATP-dependent Lon protease